MGKLEESVRNEEKKGVKAKYYTDVFYDKVIEDEEDIQKIGLLACKTIQRDFGLSFSESRKVYEADYRMPIVTFIVAFNDLIDEIKKYRRDCNQFRLDMANRFTIGFDNTDSDVDEEKEGNFCPFIFNIEKDIKMMENVTSRIPTERCNQFVDDELKKSFSSLGEKDSERAMTILNNFSAKAFGELRDLDLVYPNIDMVPCIMLYVYDQLIGYIKQKRLEYSEEDYDEVEINFCGCFNIIAREREDGTDDIIITPTIESKTGIKDDLTSGGYDD